MSKHKHLPAAAPDPKAQESAARNRQSADAPDRPNRRTASGDSPRRRHKPDPD